MQLNSRNLSDLVLTQSKVVRYVLLHVSHIRQLLIIIIHAVEVPEETNSVVECVGTTFNLVAKRTSAMLDVSLLKIRIWRTPNRGNCHSWFPWSITLAAPTSQGTAAVRCSSSLILAQAYRWYLEPVILT